MTLSATVEFRPKNYEQLFNKFKKHLMLTLDEQAFLTELRKLKIQSMWTPGIDHVLYNYSIPLFRKLIVELLSQQADNYMTSEGILGEKGAKLLLKLRP